MADLRRRLLSILALYRRTPFDGEQSNAREKATALASMIGLTFEAALAKYDEYVLEPSATGERSGQHPFTSTADKDGLLADLLARWRSTHDDDERDRLRTEIKVVARATFQEPFDADRGATDRSLFEREAYEAAHAGYKRQRAQEEREKGAGRRREAILARFAGSEEAALSPCPAEQALRDAVAPWREPDPDNPRWTISLHGWRIDSIGEMPAHVVAAMSRAVPLPRTFPKAKAEWNYWRERNLDMAAVIGRHGDIVLDQVAAFRLCLVEKLIETDLPVVSLADLVHRARFYRSRHDGIDDAAMRILDDVDALAAKGLSVHNRGQIADAIRADPSRTDRAIARELGCSPTTVGSVRAKIGLKGGSRTVHRGGTKYEGRFGVHSLDR